MTEYEVKILGSLIFISLLSLISWIDKVKKENKKILRMREEMALNYFVFKLTLSELPDVLEMPVLDHVSKDLREEINTVLNELDVPKAYITYSDTFMPVDKRLALYEELKSALAKQR